MQTTGVITRAWRIVRIFAHIVSGVVISALTWSFINNTRKQRLIRWWCKGLLTRFGFEIKVFGQAPIFETTSTLFVANHISWADIHAMNSVLPMRFIAKLELSDWPVFGYLIRQSGTLFVDRNRRKDAARIVEMAAISLQNGDNVGLFPEGTTTDGTQVLPFKSSLIQAAVSANARIHPVAIRYPLTDGSHNIGAAYAGDTTMAESMISVLNMKRPVVELHFLPPFTSDDRQAATQIAYEAINQALSQSITRR